MSSLWPDFLHLAQCFWDSLILLQVPQGCFPFPFIEGKNGLSEYTKDWWG